MGNARRIAEMEALVREYPDQATEALLKQGGCITLLQRINKVGCVPYEDLQRESQRLASMYPVDGTLTSKKP